MIGSCVADTHHLSQEWSRLKLYWYADTIGAVHVEYLDGYPVHGRETDDTLSLDTKVMIPGIGAEIEEACQLTAFGAHTREIARPVVAWSIDRDTPAPFSCMCYRD